MPDPDTAERKPRLVAVPSDGATPHTTSTAATAAAGQSGRDESRVVSRGLFWLVAVLLLLSVGGLVLQSRQVAERNAQIKALSGQVEGLQVDLSAANTRIATYQMQLGRVRESVGDLLERTALLHEMVQADPMAAPPDHP